MAIISVKSDFYFSLKLSQVRIDYSAQRITAECGLREPTCAL